MPYDDGKPSDWGPLVEQGQPLPGLRWLIRHGDALVGYHGGEAQRIWGALLPDGRTVHCLQSGSGIWRRRSDDGRGWHPGAVEIRPNSVLFADGAPIPYAMYGDNDISRGLEPALAASADFMRRLRDDSLANGLHYVLTHFEYRRIDSDERHSLGGGAAAGMIAHLRGVGEGYLDFHPGGLQPEPPAIDMSEVIDELRTAGWHVVTLAERFELHVQGWRQLRGYEKRPEGPSLEWAIRVEPSTPTRHPAIGMPWLWYGMLVDRHLSQLPILHARVRRILMALSGQISEDEFDALQHRPQQELAAYEARPHGDTPDWAKDLEQELEAIHVAEMEIYHPGSSRLTKEQRNVLYCPNLRTRLSQLARSGRVTEDEYWRLLGMLDSGHYD